MNLLNTWFGNWRSSVVGWLPAIATTIALVVLWEVLVEVLDVQRWLLPAPALF